MSRRIAIASDHAAFAMKAELAEWLRNETWTVADLGPDTTDSVDYPDYGYALARAIVRHGCGEPPPWRLSSAAPGAKHAAFQRRRRLGVRIP